MFFHKRPLSPVVASVIDSIRVNSHLWRSYNGSLYFGGSEWYNSPVGVFLYNGVTKLRHDGATIRMHRGEERALRKEAQNLLNRRLRNLIAEKTCPNPFTYKAGFTKGFDCGYENCVQSVLNFLDAEPLNRKSLGDTSRDRMLNDRIVALLAPVESNQRPKSAKRGAEK